MVPQAGVYLVTYSIEVLSSELTNVNYFAGLVELALPSSILIPGTDFSVTSSGDILEEVHCIEKTAVVLLSPTNPITLQLSAYFTNNDSLITPTLTIPVPSKSYSPYTSASLTLVLIEAI